MICQANHLNSLRGTGLLIAMPKHRTLPRWWDCATLVVLSNLAKCPALCLLKLQYWGLTPFTSVSPHTHACLGRTNLTSVKGGAKAHSEMKFFEHEPGYENIFDQELDEAVRDGRPSRV